MIGIARFLLLVPLLALGACSITRTVTPDPNFAITEPPPPPPAGVISDGAIYSPQTGLSLFEDRTALRVGDILTVLLSESTAASTSASTSTQKNDSIDTGIPTVFGNGVTYKGKNILQNVLEAERSFTGSGDSSQSNSLTGDLTVTVSRVLANGNLQVRGEKIIGINQSAEFVRLKGVVRPQDVTPDNTVLSSKVANAQIYYGGGGAVAEANTKGWLSRFFNSAYWPF
ncbi:MAG: flagellar basal body L-ring protein FlgH [Gammaproteobacteria bacterium]|nr:flagellar basal body L-ring protein FlgH [Gammaproteobacteria bacterium]